MSQEGRALHEKHRHRRHADIGHDVTAVFPAPLVRQTRTGRPQPRYTVLDRSHTTLESDSLQPAHCRIAPRFNLSHSPLNVALSAKMRIAEGNGLAWPNQHTSGVWRNRIRRLIVGRGGRSPDRGDTLQHWIPL